LWGGGNRDWLKHRLDKTGLERGAVARCSAAEGFAVVAAAVIYLLGAIFVAMVLADEEPKGVALCAFLWPVIIPLGFLAALCSHALNYSKANHRRFR
jgi:hypothetical protein